MKAIFQRFSITLLLASGLSTALAATTTIKVSYAIPTDSHYGAGAVAMCQEIEKNTEGRYKCQHFPSAALGGERESIEAAQLGTQDLVVTSSGPLGNFVPETRIFDIPFLFRGYDHARKTLDGEIGQEMLAKMRERGLIGLAWAENGFRHMTNNKHPIVSARDTAGLKIRTMENKVHMEGYKTFGMLPTPMAFPELFTALQQGTVDGQENPIPGILAAKFSQVQKYISLTGHVYSPAIFTMSPAMFNAASETDRKIFEEAAKVGARAMRQRVADDESRGLAILREQGMEVTENVDVESFRKAITPAYADFAREFGADKIRAIQAVR